MTVVPQFMCCSPLLPSVLENLTVNPKKATQVEIMSVVCVHVGGQAEVWFTFFATTVPFTPLHFMAAFVSVRFC